MIFGKLLLVLLAAHAFFDYPGQGPFLSAGKNRKITPHKWIHWWQLMAAHACIQAGAVCYFTGSLWLGLAEGVIHFATDTAKCEGWIGELQDQGIHIGCKVLWVLMVMWGVR